MNTTSNDQTIQAASSPPFHPLTADEVAEELGISPATVRRTLEEFAAEAK